MRRWGAFARGEIIRTHLLRPTWRLAARDDVRWLLRLTRPRVHALSGYLYRRLELGGEQLARAHDVLARSLTGDRPRIRRELAEQLAASGIECDGMRLAYVPMHAELEELICSGPRRGKQHTYALLERGEDEAGASWHAAPAGNGVRPERLAGAFLIPMYDETIVAYQDLRVVLGGPAHRPGPLDRAIVIDGRTVGSWKRTLSAASATVEATLLRPLTRAETAALAAVAERFGRFL